MPLVPADPIRITPDTWLVRQLFQEPEGPAIHCNSMVILGAEPVLVDTGAAVGREAWLEATFSLVDPVDVRWIFLSHDDIDHDGNLDVVLERCPNATLVTTWFATHRMAAAVELPLHRQRWVGDGESFTAGDRELVAVRPPVFDSPTTRGLYDARSGVYWASDAFGAPAPGPVDHVGDLDPAGWAEGSVMFASLLSPWHTLVDPARFDGAVDRIRELDPRVIASCHGPLVRGGHVDAALSLLRTLPERPLAATPGQPDLEAMLAPVLTAS